MKGNISNNSFFMPLFILFFIYVVAKTQRNTNISHPSKTNNTTDYHQPIFVFQLDNAGIEPIAGKTLL